MASNNNVVPFGVMRTEAPLSLAEAYAHILCQPKERWDSLVRQFSGNDSRREQELRRLVSTAAASGTRLPGMLIAGRYVLREELGRGSFASVWRVYDQKIEAEAALKIFLAPTSPQLIRQAVQEARTAARVRNAHVVKIYDVVMPDDDADTAYISMELVGSEKQPGVALSWGSEVPEGEDAELVLLARPRDEYEAARWTLQGARGVGAAHARRIAHRDIKPANLLLDPADRGVSVTDFGLGTQQMQTSTELHEAGRYSITLPVRPGVNIVGSPSYMAPEVAAGLVVNDATEEGQQALVRADIFGLGATLFELLTGRPPYVPGPDVAPEARVGNVLAQAQRGKILPLQKYGTRFKVSPRLQRILEKALATDPAQRHSSAAELVQDLENFIKHRPASTDLARPHVRAALWTRRNPVLVVNLVAASVLAVIAISAHQLNLERKGAIAAAAEAQRETTLALNEQRKAEALRTEAERLKNAAELLRDEIIAKAYDAMISADKAELVAMAADRRAKAALERERTARAGEADANARAEEAEASEEIAKLETKAAQAGEKAALGRV
jgi:serine/threonine protein kinase